MFAPSRTLPNFTRTLVDHGRLYLEELIGSGGFGAVYRGWDITSSSHYAVKVMLTPALGSSEEKLLSAEIDLHKRVTKHKHIVTFHKCIVDGPFTFILLDLCSGDDLYSRIQQHQYKFNDELIRSTMIQIIDALQYCHDKDVYHRDLKPENILTSGDGRSVFLADFGLSTSDDVSDQLRVGTLEYMSPECVRLDSYSPFYLPKYNDIWSMGIILINLVTDSYPWDSAQSTDPLFEEYLNNPDFITENTPIEMSSECSKLVTDILRLDPFQRVSLAQMRSAIESMDTFFMEPGVERSSS
ncbi:kinase-like domain-containing protein [Mucidula mucida]|nr:kinase-like domain-containing protein [Mucidula mucida]